MRFGVREICDVVLKAKTAMKVGNRVFYKNEPVCYFDSLKTSSMETQSNAVYAQGGRGNARLISWEGERTVTFTMEDALISPISFSILSGAGVIEAGEDKKLYMHTTEQTNKVVLNKGDGEVESVTIILEQKPYVRGDMQLDTDGKSVTYGAGPSTTEDFIYVMLLDDNGEVISEPYIASELAADVGPSGEVTGPYTIKIYADETTGSGKNITGKSDDYARKNDLSKFKNGSVVLVDYYVEKRSGAKQINISPETFGGNFYLEASTLFRTTQGIDVPAEFVIPNCKVQSNFTFTMAATGDPSTFTFTMDAFPDYTRWDRTKKVFASIIFADDAKSLDNFERYGTAHDFGNGKGADGANVDPYAKYVTDQQSIIEDPRRTKE